MSKQSKVVPIKPNDKVQQEAAEWLVKLDNRIEIGDFSETERQALQAWLSANPEHTAALKRQLDVWHDMDRLVQKSALRKNKSFIHLLFSLPAIKYSAVIALAFSTLLIVTLSLFSPEPPPTTNNLYYITGVGEQRFEILPDGSSIQLNTDSIVHLRFDDKRRDMTLVRGEASFDVAHDPERPFAVFVKERVVTAIGTQFIVRLRSDQVTVTVTQGKIVLTRKNDPPVKAQDIARSRLQLAETGLMLKKGQQAEIADDSAPTLATMDEEQLAKTISWTKGDLVFDDERLELIIAEVNRYTSTPVIIADPLIKDMRFSGRFKVGDTEALLEALEVSRGDLEISRIGNKGGVTLLMKENAIGL